LGSKGNKVVKNYHFLWKKWGEIDRGFWNADCGIRNNSFIWALLISIRNREHARRVGVSRTNWEPARRVGVRRTNPRSPIPNVMTPADRRMQERRQKPPLGRLKARLSGPGFFAFRNGAESHQVGKDSLLGVLLKGLQDQTHTVTLRHQG
jgi:hypothetical protein